MADDNSSHPSNVSETELRGMKLEEPQEKAKNAGISGSSDMRKEELVHALADASREGRDPGENDVGAGPDGGELRWGEESSTSLKYAQEVTSPEDEPERDGRSLATTNHEVIKQWAQERGGVPAAVAGTEHGKSLGVPRFDFGGDDENLRHVSWQEWFDTFDERELNFLYQQQRSDGRQSNFFRLENPHREDA